MSGTNIKINSASLLESIECEICNEAITNCSIIACGHSFCNECILKWLNTNSTCPSCKSIISKESIRRNFLYEKFKNTLFDEIKNEEETKLKREFMLLNFDDNDRNGSFLNNSQYKQVFFNELSYIFNSYDEFFSKLNFEKIEKIEIEKNKNRVGNLKQENNNEIEVGINKHYKDIEDCLLLSIKSYMKNIPSSPIEIPIKINLKIIDADIRNMINQEKPISQVNSIENRQNPKEILEITGVTVRLSQQALSLFNIIKEYYINKGDPIVEYDNIYFYINSDNKNYISNINDYLITLPIFPSCTIYLKADLLFKSQQGQCFKYEFSNGNFVFIDYFRCDDCNLNWICNHCRVSCHTDHLIKLYKQNHSPTWACCYCSKGKCKIMKQV